MKKILLLFPLVLGLLFFIKSETELKAASKCSSNTISVKVTGDTSCWNRNIRIIDVYKKWALPVVGNNVCVPSNIQNVKADIIWPNKTQPKIPTSSPVRVRNGAVVRVYCINNPLLQNNRNKCRPPRDRRGYQRYVMPCSCRPKYFQDRYNYCRNKMKKSVRYCKSWRGCKD